jgi:putative peptidoglycan lipid II flippase
MTSNKDIFKVAWLVAVITIVSKVVGFWRDVVIAQAYGASVASDAYFYAYQVPALALILLGGVSGPFHTVTVSIFSKEDLDGRPSRDSQKALNTFLNLTGVLFLILTVLIYFFAEPISKVITAGGTVQLQDMVVQQLKIMSPIIFVGGIVGILYGIANVYNKFFLSTLSPTMASFAIIVALLGFGHDKNGLILAWSTLVGAILQLIIQLPAYFQVGFKYLPDLDLKMDKIKKIGEIIFPAVIGCSIGQLNIYIDMFFASQLPEGSWSAISYANKIFQFPVGIIMTAMLVPLFPVFSNLVGKKDWDSLRTYFHKGLNSLWFMAFPVFSLLFVFSQDAIHLLFERGNFDANDTLLVTSALVFLAYAIFPYVARDLLTRIFYAFDDTKTPFLIAVMSIFTKAIMNFLLVKPFGLAGITLSTAAMAGINLMWLAFLVRKKVNLEFGRIKLPLLKITAATFVMTAVGMISNTVLHNIFADGKLYVAINLVLSVALATAAYFTASLALKLDIAEQLFCKIKARFIKNTICEEISENN